MGCRLCFVILNYKQPDLTISSVRNIESLVPNVRFVIVDNNSNDGSSELLKEEFNISDSIYVIDNNVNSGYAKGNNLGIREAIVRYNPEFIAIMNPDVRILERQTIDDLLGAFYKDPELAICTGLMLDIERRFDVRTIAWKIPKKLDDFFLNLPINFFRIDPTKYKSFRLNKNGLIYVEVVPGSFFFARTKYFMAIGAFDENTFLYSEERIIGIKAKNHGYKVALVPNAFFIHAHEFKNEGFRTIRKSYKELLRSRLYYNLRYNSWPKSVVVPFFFISAGLGYLLLPFAWLKRKL